MKRDKSKAYNLDDLSLGEIVRLARVGRGESETWNGVARWNYVKAMHNLTTTRGLRFEVLSFDYEVWVIRKG